MESRTERAAPLGAPTASVVGHANGTAWSAEIRQEHLHVDRRPVGKPENMGRDHADPELATCFPPSSTHFLIDHARLLIRHEDNACLPGSSASRR